MRAICKILAKDNVLTRYIIALAMAVNVSRLAKTITTTSMIVVFFESVSEGGLAAG